jgi:hypothetical protein
MDEGIRMVSMLVQKQSNDLRPSILDGIGGRPSLLTHHSLNMRLQPQKAQNNTAIMLTAEVILVYVFAICTHHPGLRL